MNEQTQQSELVSLPELEIEESRSVTGLSPQGEAVSRHENVPPKEARKTPVTAERQEEIFKAYDEQLTAPVEEISAGGQGFGDLYENSLSSEEITQEVEDEATTVVEIPELEPEVACIQAFHPEDAPAQLRNAGQQVNGFFSDKHVSDGTVVVSVKDGAVSEILFIDVPSLTFLGDDLEDTLLDNVASAIAGANGSRDNTEAEMVGVFSNN